MDIFYGYVLKLIETAEGCVMYVLAAICVAMIIDFLSGTFAAKINPDVAFIMFAIDFCRWLIFFQKIDPFSRV